MRRFHSARTRRSPRGSSFRVEILEGRRLLNSDLLQAGSTASAITSATASPVAIGRPLTPAQLESLGSGSSPIIPSGVVGQAVSGPYTPAQIRHAYGIDQLAQDGTGQTIAIVDAYDDPSIATDLAAFDKNYNLPAANFTKAMPQGTPAYDGNWALEISLDVEWAHVVAPGAKILLVESVDASDTNLLAGVQYAVSQGANQVSMSWGGSEFSNESYYDSYSYFGHPGVTFLAATGDTAGAVDFPAVSPYVTAVGGTSISLDSVGDKLSETAWSSGGGGLSTQDTQPVYQAGFLNSQSRAVPDVSYDANQYTGVIVDDNGGWYGVGGTSAGAPQWAGLVALANQGRSALGRSPVGAGQSFGTNTTLYQLAGGTGYTNPNGDFQDITSGSLSTTPPTPTAVGYDEATGLGSPVANKLIPDLIGPLPPPATPTVADSGFESAPIGTGRAVYVPAGSAWTFASSGVAGNSSGFTSGNPQAPQGSQVAFLQTTGSFSQSVAGWAAGSYAISFDAAQRGNYGRSAEDFEVTVDGNVVGTFKPVGTSYQPYTSASFTVTAGAHAIKFVGLDSVGGDNSALIDAVSVALAAPATVPTVADSGFESAPIGTGRAIYDPTGSAWTFASSGVAGNSSGFTSGNPQAPQGSQVAFLQTTGSFSQSVAGWAAGSYAISFDAAQRGNYGRSAEDFEVTVDGNVVGTFKPTGTSYQPYTSASFTVTAGAHAIKFVGLDSVGGDNSALIDAVSVALAAVSTNRPISDAGLDSVAVEAGGSVDNPDGSALIPGNPSSLQGLQIPSLPGNDGDDRNLPGPLQGRSSSLIFALRRGLPRPD